MKKYLLTLTTLALLLCESSISGGGGIFAATSYTLSSGVLTITGTGAMTDYNSSTAMPWNSDKASVTSIVISEGVTSVGKYAFYGCSNATSVQIASTVTSIGQYAFQNCSKLATVKFGTSTTYKCNIDTIQSSAFSSCTAVANVYCYGSSTTDAMARWLHIGFNDSSSNPFNASTVATKYFYTNSSRQTTLTTSNLSGATAIKQFAFYNNTSLTAITLPTTLTSIGKQAFKNCSNSSFTKITIPENVTVCGDEVFTGCSSLNSVTWNAINCTKSTASSTYTASVNPFYNSTVSAQITSFTFWENVEVIPSYLCSKMSNLPSIVIPASVTSIGSETFKGCTSLESIVSLATTPPTVANVNAFTSVTKSIPVVVTSADAVTAYEGATGWSDFTNISTVLSGSCGTSATFELDFATGTLTIDGTGAMTDYSTSDSNRSPWYKYNSYITDIVVSSGITALGNAAFANCDVETCTIPASVTNFVTQCFFGAKVNKLYYGGTLSQWCNITRGANNPHPVTQKFYISSSEVTSLTLPSVSSLAAKALMNMKGITAVTIPASITTIGADAFSGCSNIANVYYQGSLAQWCAISFSNDQEANPAYNGASLHITDSDINDGVVFVKNAITSIGNYAFCGVTNYTSIDINAATIVGAYTFKNCTAQILYRGSASGTSGNVSWSWSDGVLTLSGSGTMTNYTSAANVPWTPYMGSTHEVIVEDGITSIGNYAFNSPAASPVTVTLPSTGLTTIGNSSFSGLTALRELTIPNGVTNIGTNAFSSCTNLEKIYCPSTVPTLTNAAGGGYTVYNSFASNAPFYVLPASYASYTSSTWISFGSNFFIYGDCGASGDNAQWVLTTKTGILTISGTGAMADFASSTAAPWNGLKTVIASLSVANGVTTIGKYAFYGCTAITSLNDLPSSITTMGYQAFYGCTALASVTIPQNVIKAGDGLFNGCSSLTTVVWNAENCTTSLNSSSGDVALSASWNPFYGSPNPRTKITSFTFGSNVKVIPNGLCSSMSNLTSVTIPSSVESIGDEAFKSTGLTSISIPNNVTSIGTGAFQSCTALASVTLPSGITSIGSNTFNGCTALTSLDIPAAVESIGNYAFKNCTGLTEMHSYNTDAPSVSSTTFEGLSSTAIKIYVPTYTAKLDYEEDDYWDADQRTIIALSGYCGAEGHEEDVIWTYDPDEGTLTISGDGPMADYDYTSDPAPWASMVSEITELVIEEGVTTIGKHAFYAAYAFTEISLPESLEASKSSSFATINSSSLDRLNYAGTLAQWCDVDIAALSSTPMNYGTPDFYANGTQITGTVTIPEGIETIKGYTLINLGITNLYLPSTLDSIGSSAVDKNETTLTNVYYAGSAADWCSVRVANNSGHPLSEGKDNSPQLYCNGVKPTSLVVPAGVTSLSDYHFYNCQELTSVTISADITAIGANTFKNCSKLATIVWNATNCPNFNGTSSAPFYSVGSQITSITFGSSVQNIPGYLCYGMSNASLTSISIPNSVQSIGNYTFRGCTNLDEINFGAESSLTALGSNAFENCSSLTEVILPSKLREIKGSTFNGCSSLESVTIPDSVKLMATSSSTTTFNGCTALRTINWNAVSCANFNMSCNGPSSCSYFTPFKNVTSLITTFNIGENVQVLPRHLCYGMSSLTSITLPDGLETIGDRVFYDCTNLASITSLSEEAPSVGEDAWHNVSTSATVTVKCPATETAYKENANWSRFDTDWSHVYGACDEELDDDASMTDLAEDGYRGDLTVKDGTLTMDDISALDVEINNLTVQPGARIELADGASYTIDNLILQRSGTSSTDEVATASIQGSLTAENLILDFELDDSRWFAISLPKTIAANLVTDAESGTALTPDEDYYALYFDGEARADDGYSATGSHWKWVTSGNLNAGQGYLIGLPDGSGTKTLRFTMADYTFDETADKNVAVSEYASWDATNAGWNLVGNPYLQAYHHSTSSMAVEDKTLTAMVTMSISGANISYNTPMVDDAIIPPFSAVFVQAPVDGSLEFKATSARKGMRARYAENKESEYRFLDITLTGNGGSDHTSFIVGNYSDDYSIGADMVKWFNDAYATLAAPTLYSFKWDHKEAVNARSEQRLSDIPLGYHATQAGVYTFALSGDYPAFEHIWLYDQEQSTVTDLKMIDYEFYTEAGTQDVRFTITAELPATGQGGATDITGNEGMSNESLNSKFIRNNRLFIRKGDKLYTVMGQETK